METPRVLRNLCSILKLYIHKNEELVAMHIRNDDIRTVFHGSKAPNLSLYHYLQRIFKYSACSLSCFVIAYIYLCRFLHQTNVCLTSLNVHRLLLTCVMVAAKFIDNACLGNAYYAKVGGVSTREMNRLEMHFLFDVDFRLHVSPAAFEMYCRYLEETDLRSHSISREDFIPRDVATAFKCCKSILHT